MKFSKFLLWAITACLPVLASGGESPAGGAVSMIEEVVVTGHPLSAEGLAQPAEVLLGEELDRKAADSIGATVGNEPGIHNASFGAAVGRPVIHGLGGVRVRVLEDRIDTMDVSVTSGDHAVTVEPFIANRVEILKGPSTLLYGSGAIGGVVDVHTGRIPHQVPAGLDGKLDLRAGDNGDARNGSFRLDGGSGNFAWHFDGFARDADDYEIPGFAESALLRAMEAEEEHHEEHEGEHEEDHDEHEEGEHEEHHDEHEGAAEGTLPGSGLEVLGGSAGFSLVGERGFVGFSVAGLDAEYGIPGHGHAHGHGEEDEEHHDDEEEHHDEEEHDEHEEEEGHGEEGTPFIDLKQTRLDFEAGLADPLPGFTSLNLRLGINDYEHQEVEPSGEVGTAFENDAWEARAELSHRDWAGWRGTLGMQYSDRSFSVVGEEAFTPPVDTTSFGLFWVGERSFPGFELEAGVRYDHVEHEPAMGGGDDFSGVSVSFGAIMPLGNAWKAALLADYSTRAPVGEELYSNGPHLATQSFEIGNVNLDDETALNLAATLDGKGERWLLRGTLYYAEFDDFIYQMATGEEIDHLDVRQYRQANATFLGLDLEASATVAVWPAGRLEVSAFFDIVAADLDISGNDNLPLIPPERGGLGLTLNWGSVDANLEYTRAFKQNDVADFELATDAYDDLRAYLGWHTESAIGTVRVYLQGRNLTDDEQRRHTSIIKDLAPAPGRTIEAGVRVTF